MGNENNKASALNIKYRPTKSELVDSLTNFRFSGDQIKTYAERLSSEIFRYGTKNGEFRAKCTLDVGKFGDDDYAILIEQLSANSVNAVNPRSGNAKTKIFRSLKFMNVKGYPQKLESTRKGIMIGRLAASHHSNQPHAQSRWVVFLDEKKNLWALSADAIDEKDACVCPEECGQCEYEEKSDTAFGAEGGKGGAVLLGKIWQMPMAGGKKLPHTPKVFDLNWETTALDLSNRDLRCWQDKKTNANYGRLSPTTNIKCEDSLDVEMFNTCTFPRESEIAQEATNAGDVEMSDVYIHPDRLKAQQEALKEEREKMVH